MAASPKWKVYSALREYFASFHHPDHAAMLLSGLTTKGTTIRNGHNKSDIVWTDGVDGWANESYDIVATHCHRLRRTIGTGAGKYPIGAHAGDCPCQGGPDATANLP